MRELAKLTKTSATNIWRSLFKMISGKPAFLASRNCRRPLSRPGARSHLRIAPARAALSAFSAVPPPLPLTPPPTPINVTIYVIRPRVCSVSTQNRRRTNQRARERERRFALRSLILGKAAELVLRSVRSVRRRFCLLRGVDKKGTCPPSLTRTPMAATLKLGCGGRISFGSLVHK